MFAEHIETEIRVECEVFVDKIVELEILTSTRIINVGDSEAIDVQGFDEFHNVFSDLEGFVHIMIP